MNGRIPVLSCGECQLIHALHIAHDFRAEGENSTLSHPQRQFLDALPEGIFDTADAKELKEEFGVSGRTIDRWLKRFSNDRLILDMGYSQWKKPLPGSRDRNVAGVISVISVISVIFDDLAS